MKNIKTLTTGLAMASLALGASLAVADEEVTPLRPGALFESPAADAGGTPGEQGVGGSIEVESAGPLADQTSPYDELGDFDAGEEEERLDPELIEILEE